MSESSFQYNLPTSETSAVEPTTAQTESIVRPTGLDVETSLDQKPKRQFLAKRWQKILAVVLIVLIFLGSVGAVLGFYTLAVVQELKSQATDFQVTSQGAYDQFKAQNLPGSEESVKVMAEKMKNIRRTYNKLALYNVLPIAHNYYQDGLHGLNAADAGIAGALQSLQSITPYADVLGFKGQGTFTGGTTEDRLKVILETLTKVTPDLDKIASHLETVKAELAYINPNRYPETFQGKPVRSSIMKAQEVSNGAVTILTEFRPALEQLPSIAGASGKRKKYFILFQNNNELRPTGGFLTAYAIIYVENGKVTLDQSDDIYQLDKRFGKKIAIPPVLGKYLTTEKYFNLRDMNIYPDFTQSMAIFLPNYESIPGQPKDIDGIIAVDTQVLTDLVTILGPIEVPGFGTFSANKNAKCDCPDIIYALSEITDRPTPFIRQDRKGILGPMMRTLLTKAYAAPKTQWPSLFETVWNDVQARHVQFHFFDEAAQTAAATVGAAGQMKLDPKAQDFIAVVDANLGGAKSNLFVNSEITQEVSTPANGMVNKKVTITYKNTHPGDNCNLEAGLLCLNATLKDWNRIYLPKGSKLINSQGYRADTVKQYDEGDFTVIDGEFRLDPMSQAKIQVEYSVPYTDTVDYRVKIWKQGGTKDIPVLMDVNGGQEKVVLNKDLLFETKF
jgi:hypothetical protein